MEAFMYRHHPQTSIVAGLVAGGSVGRLRTIRISSGFRLDRPGDVRFSAELEGGALMDVGCYSVSGARLLAGEPERVHGEQVVGETGVDVAFHGTLRFPGDVVAQFDSSFVQARGQRLAAVGEQGKLVVETPFRPDSAGAVLLTRGGDDSRRDPGGPHVRAGARELRRFDRG
jgi:D-xylose 1-dehydrogenase (NADP+, D-xylono-1,5-lactone-forming)